MLIQNPKRSDRGQLHGLSERLGMSTRIKHRSSHCFFVGGVILVALIMQSGACAGWHPAYDQLPAVVRHNDPVPFRLQPAADAANPTSVSAKRAIKKPNKRSGDRAGVNTALFTTTVFADDFEGSFPAAWQVIDDSNNDGGEIKWGHTRARRSAGQWSVGCADGGANARAKGAPYPNNMNTWIIYGPLDLSNAIEATLSFRYWLKTEANADYFHFRVSVDGQHFYGKITAGNSQGWKSASLDLTKVPGLGDITGQPKVWIAFTFDSNGTVQSEGVYVDQVKVTKTSLTPPVDLALQQVDTASVERYHPGSYIPVTMILKNLSNDPSASHGVDFYASNDANITRGDTWLMHGNTLEVPPGEPGYYKFYTRLPGNLAPGTYYIGAMLEHSDANPANNRNHDPTPINVVAVGSPAIDVAPVRLVFDINTSPHLAQDDHTGTLAKVRLQSVEHNAPVRLRSGTIDPQFTTVGAFESLSANAKLPAGHRLLNFSHLLSPEQRSRLQSMGLFVLQYVTGHAYWVSVKQPVSVTEAERIAGDIRWVWQADAGHKLATASLREAGLQNASGSDTMLDVEVLLFEDVAATTATTALEAIAGVGIAGWTAPHIVRLRLSGRALQAVAALDSVHWIEPTPPPDITLNTTSAARIKADVLQTAPYFLDGEGVVVGVWDIDGIYPHWDFDSRLSVENESPVQKHATHVTGTIGGSGSGNPEARGTAPQVQIHYYDTGNYMAEMWMASQVDLSNHSYATNVGWRWNHDSATWEDQGNVDLFGQYTNDAALWDRLVINTHSSIFKAVGNDRDDGPDCPNGPRCDGPFDSIPHKGVAKNVISVCATDDDDHMSGFSSWGPADDGRVKPDLCANGVTLTSTCPDDGYCTLSGTSMAAPSATGAGTLLFQHLVNTTDSKPAPELLKALMINGARDRGRPGPDYAFGWGLINAQASANQITQHAYVSGQIADTGLSQSYAINVRPDRPELRATLVWTDPAGSPEAPRALVNDLDLVLFDPDGKPHHPWVLDKDHPGENAHRAFNHVDNVEQVLVKKPVAGVWTARVKGWSIPVGPQDYSLVAKGIDASGSFMIFNDGEADLTVNKIALQDTAAWISWSPQAPFVVPPGRSKSVRVLIDYAKAPKKVTGRTLSIHSNDPHTNPFPGGVRVTVKNQLHPCYALTLTHTGSGLDPLATPVHSAGCDDGSFRQATVIKLKARPSPQWRVGNWSGTNDNAKTTNDNQLTMPGATHKLVAHYVLTCRYVVKKPNGGQLWTRGNSYSIEWEKQGNDCGATTRLELLRSKVLDSTIKQKVSGTAYLWTIPQKLAAGNTFRVRVSDNANATFSDQSNKSFVITLPRPTGVRASDGTYAGRVRVTFNTVPGTTVYRVFRCQDTGPDCGLPIGYPKTGVFDDRKGTQGVKYYYRVRACAPSGCGLFSVANRGYSSNAPGRPTGVRATDGTYTNRVHVTFNTVPGATVYRVFRCPNTGPDCGLPIGYPKTGVFDDRKGLPGMVYYYRVRACNLTTCGLFSVANAGHR